MTMAALIAAAIAALVFTGCTTGDPDLPVALTPAYIIGGATAGDAAGTEQWSTMRVPITFAAGKATYEFTHSAAKETVWGNGPGKTSFKLLLDEGGATAWGTNGGPITAGTEIVTDVGGGNIVLDGLTGGTKYKITITASGLAIKVKFE